MWTPEHRRAANRSGLRYPSDLTDDEWAVVASMIPPARHGGRKRSVNVREVLNGIFYVLWTGCQWKALPKDLPPKSTVPADVQDRDGAFHLLRRARRMFPFIERIFADGGYTGQKMVLVAWRTGTWRLQI